MTTFFSLPIGSEAVFFSPSQLTILTKPFLICPKCRVEDPMVVKQ